LYLSPLFEAVPGSEHGYDVVDFNAISRERGGEESLRALDRRLLGMDPPMGMILDIVPNHMAARLENPYWRDVLERGRKSPHWPLFDFRLSKSGKIEIPAVPEKAETLIAAGDIALVLEDADVVITCGNKLYPVNALGVRYLKRVFGRSGARSFGDFLEGLSPAGVADVLNKQNYIFVPWVKAAEAVSYRRFFFV
jgi:(1->4)-alpha-D-glucan 1-alpha-D-glucosylmutase